MIRAGGSAWGQLFADSVVRPREAARRILALALPGRPLLEAAVAVACLGMLLGWAALAMRPEAIDPVTAAVLGHPLLGALAQLVGMGIVVLLTVKIGQLFGGHGGLHGGLALVVWLNFVLVLIQAGQLVALAVLPPLAMLLAVATFFWAIWAFAAFVAELHGFRRPTVVLGAVVLAVIVLFFGTAMLLAILGVTSQETS